MKRVRFEIKDHSDRMNMLKAFIDNGYDAEIEIDTSYIPRKTFISVTVHDGFVFSTTGGN